MFAYFRFRMQRWRRRLRREVRLISSWSHEYFNRHIWGKWRQLGLSRRLIAVWWSLALIMVFGLWNQIDSLASPYRHIGMVKAASFSEGGLGPVKVMNPVLPDNTATSDVDRLIFSGLTQYDSRGNLVPDLATSWEISADGKAYTFHLRHGVQWHDGVPFSSQDVAFTLAAIQNPDTRSPVSNSWQGINIETKGDDTVIFHLPNAYPPFLASTTQGIIPAHSLDATDPAALRANDFNQHPIGTGPFMIKTFLADQNQVVLEANPHYYAGAPKLKEVDYRWYDSASAERQAYAKHQILAFGGVKPSDLDATEKLHNLRLNDYSQPAMTLLILRNSQPILSDVQVRTAIAKAIDRRSMISGPLSGLAQPLASAILPGQLGYKGQYQLPGFDESAANDALNAAGWTRSGNGLRKKDGQDLKLNLTTRSGGIDETVAGVIKTQLAKVGIGVTVNAVDITQLVQSHIRPRNYDMLLFGYNIGDDPDVYAYWDSSQAADPGLNLAVYKNPVADKALESARVNLNDQIRLGKYQSFQQQWQADVPSVPLYSQSYSYAVSDRVVGPVGNRLVNLSDRFYNIQNWTIATAPVR